MRCWSGSLEGRKAKWEDVDPEIVPYTLAVPTTGLGSSLATTQALKCTKPKGTHDRDLRWKQGQTQPNYEQTNTRSHSGYPSEPVTRGLQARNSGRSPPLAHLLLLCRKN